MRGTVFLLGGFGNNLFQILLFLYLSQGRCDAKLNTFFVSSNIVTRFLNWDRHSQALTTRVLTLLPEDRVENRFSFLAALSLVSYVFRRIFFPKSLRSFIAGGRSSPCFLLGYYQEGSHLNKDLIDQFTPIVAKAFCDIEPSFAPDVVVHIRRGDFLKLENVSLEDQLNAASLLSEGSGTLVIVTDDEKGVREELKSFELPKELSLSFESVSAEKDFALLLSARAIVCSPSSFCYWAFTLGRSNIGYVPKKLSNGSGNVWRYFKKVKYYPD